LPDDENLGPLLYAILAILSEDAVVSLVFGEVPEDAVGSMVFDLTPWCRW
jgi:hypothetical protein